MAASPGETRRWVLNHYWRSLACASLLFVAPPAAALAQTETRFFRIGAAATGGSFFEIGGVVAAAISSPVQGSACASGGGCGVPGLVAVAQATQGSIENLRLISNKQLESGFAQADLAAMAYNGVGAFAEEGPMPRLRVIGSLFPEALHVVVRADGPIRSVADLAGKTVAVGEPGSGTSVNARLLLAAAGFGDADVTRKSLRPSQAAAEMKTGQVDAIVLAGGYPVPAIQELAASLPVRLVPVVGDVAEKLEKAFSLYTPATIPAGTYRNVDADTTSIGFYALWVVDADIDADLVHDITRAVWSDGAAKLFAGIDPIGKQIALADALKGVSLPLHPGAARFYREKGVVYREKGLAIDKLSGVEDPEKGTTQ
ncbi:MAG TPA: TAXI family TRAP transporter solute-binding subunit [Stellaceae bacterium]|nr:TAXI family TRAP transporter solute-binding subunit [Stellaceae bacterium]